uniref:Uncharacterized protein n=1 Tax=Rhizophora mucronata TaxID=61149 RepID=A0A2P2IZ44_RHIMU
MYTDGSSLNSTTHLVTSITALIRLLSASNRGFNGPLCSMITGNCLRIAIDLANWFDE